jgi:hypothetical protein
MSSEACQVDRQVEVGAELRKMQSQNAFHDQERLGSNVFVPIVHAQVLGEVVDGSLNGMACGIVVNMLLQ